MPTVFLASVHCFPIPNLIANPSCYQEKAFSKARMALAAKRQALPWRKIKDYEFDTTDGKRTLSSLFPEGGPKDLIVYHMMMGKARQYSAEDVCRLDALLFTAVAWIFIPAHCFAVP